MAPLPSDNNKKPPLSPAATNKPPLGRSNPSAPGGGATGGKPSNIKPPDLNKVPELDRQVNSGPEPEEVPPPPIMKHDGSGTFIPRIEAEDIQAPTSQVNASYCLDQFARVMLELAENQEDPNWAQAHLALAQEWHAMVDTLLQHAANIAQTKGEIEMKQQQMVHADLDHQQQMSHQDAMNKQQVQHQAEQHQKNMQMQDEMNKQKMAHQDMMNKTSAQQAQDQHKMATQQAADAHKQKMGFQDQLYKSKLAAANKPKPTPAAGGTLAQRKPTS